MAEKNKIEENFYTENLLHFYNVPLIHDKLKNFQKNRSVEEQSMYLKNILKLSDEDNDKYLEELKNYEYEVIVETLYKTFAKDKYSISLEKFKELAIYLIEDSIKPITSQDEMDNDLIIEGVINDNDNGRITITLTRDVNKGEKIIGIDPNKPNIRRTYILQQDLNKNTTIKF